MNTAGRAAVINVWNADSNVFLLSFTHADFATQRLAMTMSDVVSTVDGTGSQTYTAYPFELELPSDDKGVPRGSFRISNVTQLVMNLVRNVRTPPQLHIYRVLESDLNTEQDAFKNLDIQRIAARITVLEATFGHENYAVEPYPTARMTDRWFPWMQYIG